MSDLISRSEVWKAFISRVDSICDLEDVREILDSIPTAKPETRAWIIRESASEKTPRRWKVECSKCHKRLRITDRKLWNYCPNCGARMKGE